MEDDDTPDDDASVSTITRTEAAEAFSAMATEIASLREELSAKKAARAQGTPAPAPAPAPPQTIVQPFYYPPQQMPQMAYNVTGYEAGTGGSNGGGHRGGAGR